MHAAPVKDSPTVLRFLFHVEQSPRRERLRGMLIFSFTSGFWMKTLDGGLRRAIASETRFFQSVVPITTFVAEDDCLQNRDSLIYK